LAWAKPVVEGEVPMIGPRKPDLWDIMDGPDAIITLAIPPRPGYDSAMFYYPKTVGMVYVNTLDYKEGVPVSEGYFGGKLAVVGPIRGRVGKYMYEGRPFIDRVLIEVHKFLKLNPDATGDVALSALSRMPFVHSAGMEDLPIFVQITEAPAFAYYAHGTFSPAYIGKTYFDALRWLKDYFTDQWNMRIDIDGMGAIP